MDREIYHDDRTNRKTSDSVSIQDYWKINSFIQSAKHSVNNSKMEHFAFNIFIKGKNSGAQYHKNINWPVLAANKLMSNYGFRHIIEKELSLSCEIQKNMDMMSMLTGILSSFMVFILLKMCYIAYIITNSLSFNSVQDGTYESAMLRTLGWKSNRIALIEIIKTLLFQMIPAAVIGLSLLFLILIQI